MVMCQYCLLERKSDERFFLSDCMGRCMADVCNFSYDLEKGGGYVLCLWVRVGVDGCVCEFLGQGCLKEDPFEFSCGHTADWTIRALGEGFTGTFFT